jgi:hypothetical protein
MKKIFLVSFWACLLAQSNAFAQTICDSISIENVVLDVNSVELQVYNSSQYTIIYPFFEVNFSPNPYISFGDTLKVLSFLSIPGDGNNGFTNALYANVSFAPETSVPANTLFTGELVITDPNDSTFMCTKPFSFTYGTAIAATFETELPKFNIFPNPSEGKCTVSTPLAEGQITVFDALGKVVLTQPINTGTSILELTNAGIYTLKLESTKGNWIEKVCIH